MELLERYIKEIEADLKIDEFVLKEVSLRIPARKHFWVSRLINHKRNLLILENEKATFKKDVVKELQNKSPVKISFVTADHAAEESDKLRELSNKIAEEKLLIEFLEKTEKVMTSLSFDLKNIIDITKLEQL